MATTYYRPPSSFYSQAEQLFGPGFNVAPAQAALPAGTAPYALPGGPQLALNAGPSVGSGFSSQLAGAGDGLLPRALGPGQAAGPWWQRQIQLPSLPEGGMKGLWGKGKGLVKGKIGPAIAAEAVSQIGRAGLRNAIADSTPEQAIAPWDNALNYGAKGFIAGSMVPGVGNVIGGLAGATLGTAKGIFMDQDFGPLKYTKLKDRPRFQMNKLMKMNKVPKGVQEEARNVYADAMAAQIVGMGSKKPNMKQSMKMQTAAAQQAMAFVESEAPDGGWGRGGKRQMEKGLAAQALAARFLGPILAQQSAATNALATEQENMANVLPAEYQQLARLQAATNRSAQSGIAAAYAGQLQMVPGMRAMEEQLARDKQLEQQAYAASLQGQDAGGSESVDDIMKREGL